MAEERKPPADFAAKYPNVTIPAQTCDHDYSRVGFSLGCAVYRCNKCGDEYDRDVS